MSNNEKKYIIYCYRNKINNKKYIGQTCYTLRERSGLQGIRYKNPELANDDPKQPCFWRAICKYGWDNFESSILESNLTLEEANIKEQYWIAYYHTWIEDPLCWGYNLQKGGNNHQVAQETKQKLSEKFSGENNPFYGHHHTDEVKQRISQARSTQPGRKQTEATRKKLSEDRMGEKHHNAKKVLCVETGIIYGSIREAARENNQKSPTGINDCCHGRRQTAGGFHWKLL